jgi:hypothetical protein
MNTLEKKRSNSVKQAVANQRLEGLKGTAESIKIANNYIVGKASAIQAANKIRSRYGAV